MYSRFPGMGDEMEELAELELEYGGEFYRRVYEATYGVRPDKLPELRQPKANSEVCFADIDGDGEDEAFEAMFFNYYDEDSPDYNSAWFCINGQWRHWVYLGEGLRHSLCAIDIWKDSPGVEIAFEIETELGPYARIFKFHGSGGMAYVDNDAIWGKVLGRTSSNLYLTIPGDGTATGFRRSIFSPDITVQFNYSSSGDFLNRDKPEDGLYETWCSRELILAKPLRAYLEKDTDSQPVEVFAGQRITPYASDEREWLRFHTASGQEFWAYFASEADYPEFVE